MSKTINFDDLRKNSETNGRTHQFLEDSIIPPDGNAYYQKHRFRGRDTHLIYVDGHYSKETIELYQRRLQTEVLTNKHEWLFLIEGAAQPVSPEVNFFTEVAHNLGIPLGDPIASPYSNDNIQAGNFDDFEAAMAITLHELPRYRDLELISQNLAQRGIGGRYHRVVFRAMSTYYMKHLDLFASERKYFHEILEWIVRVSNSRSFPKLELILEENPQKNIMVHVGNAHLPIFKERYSPDINVPKRYQKGNTTLNDMRYDYFMDSSDPIDTGLATTFTNNPLKIKKSKMRAYQLYMQSKDPIDAALAANYARDFGDTSSVKMALERAVALYEKAGENVFAELYRRKLADLNISA